MVTRREFRKVWVPYVVELGGALVIYSILLVASLLALNAMPHDSLWRAPVAVAPMLGGLAAAVAIVRMYGRLDELERRLLLQGLAFSFAGTALVTFTYGFLENVDLVPHASWFFVWPIMGVLWIAARLWQRWRYR